MQHPEFTATVSDAAIEQPTATEFMTASYLAAVGRLNKSYAEQRPVAAVIADGKSASGLVISKFLAGLDEETAVARIAEPCADAGALMRQIVHAVGFDPKDMNATDLQSVLRMFLSFQKGHGRRTVICMEQVQDSEWWVLDRIRHLVDLEAKGKFGLMLILTGQAGLNELFHTRPLNAVGLHAGERIAIAPYTLDETTEYVRRRVEGTSGANIEQAFQFEALPLMHDLTAGVPDATCELVGRCLELADDAGVAMITTDLVQRAHAMQRCAAPMPSADANAATVNLNGLRPRAGRLLVQITGEQIREMVVHHGHILIGRSKLCDIRIGNANVSRYHALISYTPAAVMLVDLGSTNGTYVDGYRIESHGLAAGETITLGDCSIEYILDDEQQAQVESLSSVSVIARKTALQ